MRPTAEFPLAQDKRNRNPLRSGNTEFDCDGVAVGKLCLLGATFAGLAISGEMFPRLFRWLALAGAVYLVWLAANAPRSSSLVASNASATSTRMPIIDGLTIAFGNPVSVVFYMAFFPQFLDPDRSVAQQTLVLAAVYFCTALTFYLVCVFILSRFRLPAGWARFDSFAELGSAAVYLAIAVIAVLGFIKTTSEQWMVRIRARCGR